MRLAVIENIEGNIHQVLLSFAKKAFEINASNEKAIFTALNNREKLGSTGIGHRIAVPHCKVESCQESITIIAKSLDGIDFDAIDNQKVNLFFCLIHPKSEAVQQLELLASLAIAIREEHFIDDLVDSNTDQIVCTLKSHPELSRFFN